MTTGREAATVQLPEEARQAIWRIFGNGLVPLKQRTWYELVAPVIQNRLGKTDAADRVIDEIRSWFDPEAQSNQLRPDMNDAVAEMIIEGIGAALEETAGIRNHDTAFWAMGSIHPDIAAPLINNAWCTDQIDAFAAYAVDTLESLHEKGDIRDPKRVFGEDVQGAKARPSQTGLHDPLRTFQVGPDTAFEAWRQMYSGIPQVVALLLELKPAMLPELVGRVEDPLLQSLAAFCASGLKIPSDHHQPLQWVTDTSPAALIAMAIDQVMAIVRETEFAGRTAANIGIVDTREAAPVSNMIGDMVDSLAALEPVGCTRWLFELLNHTSFGPNEKLPTAELVERHCTQLLEKVILDHWSVAVANELVAGLQRATLDPRGKPLADIALMIRDQEPEKASQISGLLLDEHERRMTEALADDLRSLHLSDHWNQREWLIALGAAVVTKHTDLDPLDWTIEKCKALPLSAWDADEEEQVFRRADKIAQVQMTIGLYAVKLLADAGRNLDRGKLRAFAEQVWDHAHFVRRHSVLLDEHSRTEELAARVAAALGEPDHQWILQQANNPAVVPRTLWALLDQLRRQTDARIHVDTVTEIRRIASNRYINAVDVNPRSVPHLANLWVLLDAPQEAARTAEVLLTRRRSRANRADAIPVLKMLACAASRGELAEHLITASQSLYNDLWGQYTPQDEVRAREEIDALLNQCVMESDDCRETE